MSAPLVTLDNSTKKLQVLLGGAVAATECPLTAVVEDERKDAIGGRADTTVQRQYDGITTSGTAVDLVPAAPSNIRRKVMGFSLYNDDSAAVTVTVRLYVDASTTRVLWKGDVQTDECLFYSPMRGWYATDTNANQKSNASSTSGATSEAKSAAVSVSTIASTNLSAETSRNTSQSTLISANGSSVTSHSTVVSTNDSDLESKNTSQSVLLSELTSRVSSGE